MYGSNGLLWRCCRFFLFANIKSALGCSRFSLLSGGLHHANCKQSPKQRQASPDKTGLSNIRSLASLLPLVSFSMEHHKQAWLIDTSALAAVCCRCFLGVKVKRKFPFRRGSSWARMLCKGATFWGLSFRRKWMWPHSRQSGKRNKGLQLTFILIIWRLALWLIAENVWKSSKMLIV